MDRRELIAHRAARLGLGRTNKWLSKMLPSLEDWDEIDLWLETHAGPVWDIDMLPDGPPPVDCRRVWEAPLIERRPAWFCLYCEEVQHAPRKLHQSRCAKCASLSLGAINERLRVEAGEAASIKRLEKENRQLERRLLDQQYREHLKEKNKRLKAELKAHKRKTKEAAYWLNSDAPFGWATRRYWWWGWEGDVPFYQVKHPGWRVR